MWRHNPLRRVWYRAREVVRVALRAQATVSQSEVHRHIEASWAALSVSMEYLRGVSDHAADPRNGELNEKTPPSDAVSQ
jgi:hypothetical protein